MVSANQAAPHAALGSASHTWRARQRPWGVLVTTVLQHLEQCLVVSTHLLTKRMTELKHLLSWEHLSKSFSPKNRFCIYASMELCSLLCDNINATEIQKGGDICVHMADSLCCEAGISTAL